jgi:hypothetical protein
MGYSGTETHGIPTPARPFQRAAVHIAAFRSHSQPLAATRSHHCKPASAMSNVIYEAFVPALVAGHIYVILLLSLLFLSFKRSNSKVQHVLHWPYGLACRPALCVQLRLPM